MATVPEDLEENILPQTLYSERRRLPLLGSVESYECDGTARSNSGTIIPSFKRLQNTRQYKLLIIVLLGD